MEEVIKEFISKIELKEDALQRLDKTFNDVTFELNKYFDKTESYRNTLLVGSLGRKTAINTVSDLDMIYIVPEHLRKEYYNSKGTVQLLDDLKEAVSDLSKDTERRDQSVVSFKYNKIEIDVQPVFVSPSDHDEFTYPDTYKDTQDWRTVKPILEIREAIDCNAKYCDKFRHLSQMTRVWKDNKNLLINGLLIDTFVSKFLRDNNIYYQLADYHFMIKDFFKFLSNIPESSYHLALGSNQQINIKEKGEFQKEAYKSYELCDFDEYTEDTLEIQKCLYKIYGRLFPKISNNNQIISYTNTEEHIEDYHNVNIQDRISLSCVVSQDGGFISRLLEDMLNKNFPLKAKKNLLFKIELPEHLKKLYNRRKIRVAWKVLNRGKEAEKRDKIRGNIIRSNKLEHKEETLFKGEHYVECYVIENINDTVIAKQKITVPIVNNREDEDFA